jgi:hypothetical protein
MSPLTHRRLYAHIIRAAIIIHHSTLRPPLFPCTQADREHARAEQPPGRPRTTTHPTTPAATAPDHKPECPCPRKAGTTALVPCVELILDFHALLHDALRFKNAKARIKKIIHETRSTGDEYKVLKLKSMVVMLYENRRCRFNTEEI